MSTPRTPEPGMLVVSVLAASWQGFQEMVVEPLVARFGPPDLCSVTMDFTETTYYDGELGAPLFRRMLCFAALQPLDCLPAVKLFTNSLEQAAARPNSSRAFNLDPGLLTQERLVLATGKNFSHRIYLGSGIWGDLTLIFQRGGWKTLPWTFSDYAGAPMQDLLSAMRGRLREHLARLRASGHATHPNT